MKILSLNGGGIRGLILAKQLEIARVTNDFDVIAGTSAGAIIGALIAMKYSYSEIVGFFVQYGIEIFKPTILGRLIFWRRKYSDDGLNRLLKKYLGENTMFEDVKHVRLLFMVTNKETDTLKVFDSKYDKGFKLWEVVRASSSAPRYFEAFKINGVTYSDGGTKANNPSFRTLCTIRKETTEPIYLLSVTTGRKAHKMKEGSVNDGIQVAGDVIDSTLDAIDQNASFAVENIVRPCDLYIRCESFVIDSDGSVDNARKENIDNMIKDGCYSFNENKTKFREFKNKATK
jgi:patatin-like phospholipase/acyl hydrolase